MIALINAAAEGKTPLFIDPTGITSITVLPETKELSINNEKGPLLRIDYERFGLDPGKLVEKLAEAGNKLIFFPARDGRGKKEYAHYVAPSAVTFATVTQVTDGTQGVIVGVKGLGWLQSYGTKPEELQNLLEAVRVAGKNLLKFTPDIANARWSDASELYIDPASVNTIRDDGRQVNVYFDGSGSLDVETRIYSQEERAHNSKRRSEMAHKFWLERHAEFNSLTDVYAEVDRLIEAEEAAKRSFVAETIAAANGALKKVEGAKHATYLRPENYAYVTFHDDERADTPANAKYSMTFHPQKTQDTDSVRAYFNSVAARTASFNAIFSQDIRAPTEKKPAAPSP